MNVIFKKNMGSLGSFYMYCTNRMFSQNPCPRCSEMEEQGPKPICCILLGRGPFIKETKKFKMLKRLLNELLGLK